ncbi:V-type ATP synthase subunit I [Clostridium sp. AM58-1XD]|uniref:V-type ATP synthase subunit I n=1 Tax=Clostridium sp. AM58-1XD TaxID=2292307 RepID=UPI000E4D1363|nr:V-type ATP synthase subunit I [Clostridium sp. AM58-1XD]RGZ00140.1 V-type ATP synthase subunit I [Clostridium sp. AM58-1XD]
MAVLPMQKISICGLKKNRKAILELLQASGVMEIAQPDVEDGGLQKMDTMTSRQLFEKNAAMADQALEILQSYVPEKKSLLSGLEGKKLTDAAAFEAIREGNSSVMEDARQIVAFHKKIAEDKAGIVKLESQIETLAPWMNLDVPIRCPSTKKCAVLIGTMTGAVTLEEIYQAAAERIPDVEALDIHVVGSDKDQTCIAAVCLKEDASRVEDALRASGFAKPAQAVDKVPSALKQDLSMQADKLKEEIDTTENRLKAYEKSRENLRMVSDYFRIRAQKYDVLGGLLQSEKTFFVTGYVPLEAVEKLEAKLTGRFDLVFEKEEIDEDEEAPVLLKNSTFASSAEGVTASFGLPAKGEMDPTTIMSVCYIFLFGLMLSDAAYGLIVFLACFLALKKFPRMDGNLKKSVRLFMYCGISTLVWGVLFGGYFGDAVDVVAKTFFGRDVSIPALWFVPLNDPMKMLVYSMLFGVIHLYLGVGLKGYMLIKDKKYLDFFCDVVLWYMLLTGLILILIPTDLFSSIAQVKIVFPAAVNALAKFLAIAGAVGILLMSGRSSKNPALRIALGAYDLYNITGWLSDVLSYSRLLALGLATGVIASVINQMGSMAGGGILGAIVFILVFIGGHTFNLAINLLGAYVHTCRLQYVEFFGKFYEGGGKMFTPFKENTKYIEIKED